MKDCIFCKIANKEIPCYKIYEDKIVMVFLDLEPDTNGHTLIITKKHFVDINDIDDKTVLYIHNIKKDIGSLLTKKLGCDGIKFVQNNGCVQDVKHFHIHVIPEYIKTQDLLDLDTVFKKINN
jgi:histidine triad (HIT) family protein